MKEQPVFSIVESAHAMVGAVAPPLAGAFMMPVPRGEWPDWANNLAAEAVGGEASVADTVRRTVGEFGSDSFKAWYAERFGVMAAHCNCLSLKLQWSERYRYSTTL